MMGWIRLLYNLLFPIVLIFMLPGFIHRMIKRGKYRHKFAQRFGIYSPRVLKKIREGKWTWVHAVSVGEVMIALKLIHALRKADPSLRFILSTTTSTGFKFAARSKCVWLEPVYNPLDFYFTARRAVRIIRPQQLILVEAEVWPNIVCEARAIGTKVALVNARLSPRSEKRYRAARWLVGPLFNQLDVLCLQEPEDVARWISLGVEAKRLQVTGSIKFDDSSATPRPPRDFTPILHALQVESDAPILLGGSTFEGEEILLAEALKKLRTTYPHLFLILVPRHFERCSNVMQELQKLGLRIARRTQQPSNQRPDILLVDTTGELRDWYFYATVVFIGKSLTAKGGQNPAEPVVAGKPVIFGPNMQNFATLTRQFLRHNGAIEVNTQESLIQAINHLLSNPQLRNEMANHAAKCLGIHRGATERTRIVLADL